MMVMGVYISCNLEDSSPLDPQAPTSNPQTPHFLETPSHEPFTPNLKPKSPERFLLPLEAEM